MQVLQQQQLLPISIEKAWYFFATPRNLNEITPPDLTFEITSNLPAQMYEGLIITYKIKPFLNIPMDWCTEITHISEKEYFIDEQRSGPYKIWHHEHHFKTVEGGVLMTDLVYYDIGFSVFGWLAGKLFVHRRVREIFAYRQRILAEYF
ncbi:SRPBCC family protein [Pedobacter sp. SYSU D00535]|uniref:SRPBCC family protein n=1 Tax=Pedobacter sp. SYSU D00535 TaxID=2810308 RepID=UPI001A95C7CC|nr:SRPBCC family protein [Pedobacter sp. SYSU D00535]